MNLLVQIWRTTFCRHTWKQWMWAPKEYGQSCTKCGRIRYQKCQLGAWPEPLPPGVQMDLRAQLGKSET